MHRIQGKVDLLLLDELESTHEHMCGSKYIDKNREYAFEQKLKSREDGSNQELKYKLNFIRHQIVPALNKLNPAIEETIHTSVQFFKQSSEIVAEFAQLKFQSICKEENEQMFINIELLLKEKQKEALLFEWLHNKHFKTNQIQQLTEALQTDDKIGKQFSSATHKLVIDRTHIIVKAISLQETKEYIITSVDDVANLPIVLKFEETADITFSKNKNEICIPFTDSIFPLKLRRWKQGDKFKPFGMDGFKKLSDFFKDQKLSLFEKESVWILESKQQIIWVVGYRMDDRCKVTDGTERVLRITSSSKI